jgi:hypothetical protein
MSQVASFSGEVIAASKGEKNDDETHDRDT